MAERRIAAGQASRLSRTQLRDSLNAALDAAEARGTADQKLTDLVARATKQEARMAKLERGLRDNAGLGEVRLPGGIRLPAVAATGPNVDSVVQAASAATEAGRKLAKELRKATSERMGILVGPASISATDSARIAVKTARDARKAATEAIEKARVEAKLGPDERIAAIQAESRALARQYRELSERAQATSIRTRALEDELDGIRQQQAVAEMKIEGLRTAVGRTKAEATAAREGMSQIDLVPLAGYHWPTAVANTFNKRIPRPGRKYLSVEAYDAANDTLRALEATGDASAVGIQLAKLGFSEPALVVKATKTAVRSMGDPGALGKYILDADLEAVVKGEPLVETMAKYGVRFETGEITTSAHGRTTLTRAIENSTGIGKGVLEPSNRIFDNAGNFARIDLFKTLYRTWKAAGMDADAPEVLRAIAKSTNLATGYSRSSILGGPVGSRVLFAGRFFKSQLDTVGDAVTKGGIEGTIARQQVARMIGLGALLTVAANEARGHETEFRPWEPNFMRIRDVGGHDISLFGPWDSLARGIITPDWNDFEHWRDFGRSKSGPLVSAAWDLWEGKSYIGDATTTRVGVGKTSIPVPRPLWAAEKVTPFGIANAIEEFIDAGKGKQSFGDAVVGASAEFLGLKSSPLTGYEKQLGHMKNAWETYEPEGYKKPGSMQDDPLFLRKWASENADKLAGPSTELGKKVKEIEKEFGGKARANDDAFVAGAGLDSEGKARDWTLGDWKDRRRELQIEKRRAYRDLLGEREGEAKPGTPAYWVQTYFETFDTAESGLGLDFEAQDRAQADWLAEHGDAALEYVQEYLQTGKSEPERQYLEAIQQLNKDGYFEMPKYIGMLSGEPEEEIDRLRALVAERSDDPKYAPYANESYRNRAALVLIDYWKEQGKTLEEVKPIFFDVINAGSKKYANPHREVYRLKNPELLEWLDNGNHYATLQAIAGK